MRFVTEAYLLFRPSASRVFAASHASQYSNSIGKSGTGAASRTFFTPASPKLRPAFSARVLRRAYGTPGRPSLEAYHSAQRAIWVIIGINVTVFGAWQYGFATRNQRVLGFLNQHATLSMFNLAHARFHTLLTSTFSHADLSHLVFNMFALRAFGSILSFVPGIGALHVWMLALGSGFLGSATWLTNEASKVRTMIPMAEQQPPVFRGPMHSKTALGASGIVQGMGTAATCLMPLAPMNLFFIPLPIPLWIITTAYIAIDASYLNAENTRIGHAAHLGGAVYGVLHYAIWLRRFGGVSQLIFRR